MTDKSLGQIAHDSYRGEHLDIPDWEHMHPYESVRWSNATEAVAEAVRKQVAAVLAQLDIEIERLRAALTKANSQAEHFERVWCVRGDEIERLQDAWETSREAHKQLRMLLQAENEELKDRLAHSGVELQRAVADERDACMRLCLSEMKNPFSKDHNNGLQHAADAIRSRYYPKES